VPHLRIKFLNFLSIDLNFVKRKKRKVEEVKKGGK
jgi:hypothetical protein